MKNEVNLHGKNILIVGMDDFLGGHLVDALHSIGAHVHIVERSVSNKKTDGTGAYLQPANITIFPRASYLENLPVGGVYDAVKKVDVVYHLNGFSPDERHTSSDRHMIKSRYTRFMETLNLLLACREAGVTRIVQVASNIIPAERFPDIPVEDNYPDVIGINYENIQCRVEDLSRTFYEQYGLPIVTIDVQHAFGPRQGRQDVIPAMIDQALKGRQSIHLKSANSSRGFIYISDVVHGLILAGGMPGLDGMQFELSSSEKASYSDLAEMISAKLGRKFKVVFDTGEKMDELLDTNDRPATEVIVRDKLPGWTSQVHLDEGLQMMMDWMEGTSRSFP